jgi:hypothetical protein
LSGSKKISQKIPLAKRSATTRVFKVLVKQIDKKNVEINYRFRRDIVPENT